MDIPHQVERKTLRQNIIGVAIGLTEPHKAIKGTERQQARLLVSLLLALIPVAVTVVMIVLIGDVMRAASIGNDISLDSEYYSSLTAVLIVIGAYPLSRTRYYWIAKWVIILSATTSVSVAVLGTYPQNSTGDVQGLYFTTVSIFFAGILASVRATLSVGFISLISVILLSDISTGWTVFEAMRPLTLIIIITPLMALGSAIRNYYQREVEKQIETLQIAEDTLKEMNQNLEDRIQKRTEELEIERDRAEAANRSKSLFLANMSHELRTPLNAILGFTQILENNDNLTVKQYQHLSTIADSGDILLRLINNVLEMSKIEAGQATLDIVPFNLRQLLKTIHGILEQRAEDKGLYFEFDIADNVPKAIKSDESKMRQIFINLLDNAVKYTEIGGIVLTVQCQDSNLLANIADTGMGIAEEERKELFQSFTQTTSGRIVQQGTGLGLAIVKKFVTLMGGTIDVYSDFGRGTNFNLVIPIEVADDAEISADQDYRRVIGIETEGEWRVLVVDDKPNNRSLIREWLEPVGFKVREAEHGENAISMWMSWQPHFIWMDMRMPIMDGYDATRYIKEDNPDLLYEKPIIVALTASAFEHDREEVLAAGCDDFVRKPVRESVIFDKLAQYLNVTYRYDERRSYERQGRSAAALLTPKSFEKIPQDLRQRLRNAAIIADVRTLSELIIEVITHDASLADGLEELIVNFRFDILYELLAPESTTL